MTDYNNRIDNETWRFIEQTNTFYPPDAVSLSIAQQRELYNTLCDHFYAGRPNGITVADDTIEGSEIAIPVRRYSSEQSNNSSKQIIYLHGGGYVVGGLQSHDDICAEFCARTGFAVTSVDYRLAPEHTHPAAFVDTVDCAIYEYNLHDKSLFMCGDSAGANLACAATNALRGSDVRIAGQLLIYPSLGGDHSKGSYIEHGNAPMLTTADMQFYDQIRRGDKPITHDASFAPLVDNDFSALPPTLIFSAECDPLADDGMHYANAINTAGGHALYINEPGLVHGYLRARNSVERARQSFTRMTEALLELGGD